MVLGNVGSSDSVAGRSDGISVDIRTTASAKCLRLLENGFDPDEADSEGDLQTEDFEQLLNYHPFAVPCTKPLTTSSSANLCPAASANSTQASTAVKLAYTRLGNQNSQFNSNFRMHEVFDGVDSKGLCYCYILICLLTDMRWEVNIVGDRKVLNYAFWPKTMNPSDFIDQKHPEFENAETAVIVKYFSNDTNNEIFCYTFNLPEAVNSTCINKRFICRSITTNNIHGNTVTISQKVAVLCTYIISGQSSTGVQGLW
ncbi:hypothetical protein BCR33DRAFT_733633 [Rhizoclosmatium globosum]|uniref:Uncharacterized protein n=1 Tax=Rhizoclosmatium globosum TaxID=329046 RepID=A0A1Y2CW52_9FUNG|nr:hypothetical protein BCR33DRAFT_733633 [Rhizoclosmatium globosum]|eukprot:ORY51259.1 hypothetical protein BCR33DRAFT_733633 [Rhizoclosmatium globosum]